MTRFASVLGFVIATFFCWGTYGPLLHEGQEAMDHSRWRPFICVGLAYFLVAVCVPLLVRNITKDAGRWTMQGVFWSLLAGAIGAFGALGVLLAFSYGGRPLYVMPLVFGFAPVVNTMFTMMTAKSARQANFVFILGILLVALGAAGVLRFKPETHAQTVAAATDPNSTSTSTAAGEADTDTNNSTEPGASDSPTVAAAQPATSAAASSQITWAALLFVAVTALCWGTYGPLLHRGQAAMFGSRLRPFICVGISYFVVAIIIPLMLLMKSNESFSFPVVGTLWSLAAGTMGALGALGVIMAFNSGGRPVVVMPLVFGGAPIVNTAVSLIRSRMHGESLGTLSTWFIGSLLMVIVGSAVVLIFAPKAGHGPPETAHEPSEEVAHTS